MRRRVGRNKSAQFRQSNACVPELRGLVPAYATYKISQTANTMPASVTKPKMRA